MHGKMQEAGLTEIIPLIYISAVWDRILWFCAGRNSSLYLFIYLFGCAKTGLWHVGHFSYGMWDLIP